MGGRICYVGITTKTPEERFLEHIHHNRAARWTMKYKPLEIELTEDLSVVSKEYAEEYENKITRELMNELGINNVRGGDLKQTDDYIQRFGYIWDQFGWENVLVLAMAVFIILPLLIDKYFL